MSNARPTFIKVRFYDIHLRGMAFVLIEFEFSTGESCSGVPPIRSSWETLRKRFCDQDSAGEEGDKAPSSFYILVRRGNARGNCFFIR